MITEQLISDLTPIEAECRRRSGDTEQSMDCRNYYLGRAHAYKAVLNRITAALEPPVDGGAQKTAEMICPRCKGTRLKRLQGYDKQTYCSDCLYVSSLPADAGTQGGDDDDGVQG